MSVSLLAGGLVHAIGNPLTCISSLSQTLACRIADPALLRDLEAIGRHVDRIERVLNDLRQFVPTGPGELQISSLNDIVAAAVTLARYHPTVGRLRIDTVLDPGRPKVCVVPEQLLQVFLDLIFNAAAGESALRVTTTGDGSLARTAFAIRGPEIPTDGIGLLASGEIVHQHGGTLQVTGGFGDASVFTVVLPRTP